MDQEGPVSELPPENQLYPSITKYLPVPMPLPGFEPNLCLMKKVGILIEVASNDKNWVSYDAAT
jgi:hypothetical protein